jgi:hypothetical protein
VADGGMLINTYQEAMTVCKGDVNRLWFVRENER